MNLFISNLSFGLNLYYASRQHDGGVDSGKEL